jgi:hypothetical protein
MEDIRTIPDDCFQDAARLPPCGGSAAGYPTGNRRIESSSNGVPTTLNFKILVKNFIETVTSLPYFW